MANRRRTPYGFDFVAEPSQLPEYSRQRLSAGCIDSMVAESYRTYRLSTSAAMTQLCMRSTGATKRETSYRIYHILMRAVAIEYPSLRTERGPRVTYCMCASYLCCPSLTVVGKVSQKVPACGPETRHVTGSALNLSIGPSTTRRHSSRPRSPQD